MKTNLLSALLLSLSLAPAASAAVIGFASGQSLDAGDALKAAGRPDGAAAVVFLKKLGDATYSGSEGRLEKDGAASVVVESRVIVQQKTVDGLPGATIRLYRRAASAANPGHVESLSDELTLAVRGDSVILKRDGQEDAVLRLNDGSGENALAFTYVKVRVRYGAPILETLSLSLNGNALTVTREDGAAGELRIRETFSAAR